MQITLRFYREDLDLILMKACEGRNFCTRVFECIASYAEGRRYSYVFPAVSGAVMEGIPESVKVNLRFLDSKDSALVSFLGRYDPRARAPLVKTLLRASFAEYPAVPVLQALGFRQLQNIPPGDTSPAPYAAAETAGRASALNREDAPAHVAPVLAGKPPGSWHSTPAAEGPGAAGTDRNAPEPGATSVPPDKGIPSGAGMPGSPGAPPSFQDAKETEPDKPSTEADRALFEMFLNM